VTKEQKATRGLLLNKDQIKFENKPQFDRSPVLQRNGRITKKLKPLDKA
jgi:hypothetical protein